MVERFTDGAELVFEGIPVGPFHGRDAIAAAYRAQPPDDEIDLLDNQEAGEGRVWSRPTPGGNAPACPREGWSW